MAAGGLGDEGLQHGRNVGRCVCVNVLAFGQCLFDGHEIQGRVCTVGGDNLAVAVVEHAEFAAVDVISDNGVVKPGGQAQSGV